MSKKPVLAALAFAAVALPATAHHSFAIYDMSQNIEFEGVVESVKMRNPHMALTLTVKQPDGSDRTVHQQDVRHLVGPRRWIDHAAGFQEDRSDVIHRVVAAPAQAQFSAFAASARSGIPPATR